jgi:hypothetical protein
LSFGSGLLCRALRTFRSLSALAQSLRTSSQLLALRARTSSSYISVDLRSQRALLPSVRGHSGFCAPRALGGKCVLNYARCCAGIDGICTGALCCGYCSVGPSTVLRDRVLSVDRGTLRRSNGLARTQFSCGGSGLRTCRCLLCSCDAQCSSPCARLSLFYSTRRLVALCQRTTRRLSSSVRARLCVGGTLVSSASSCQLSP